MAGYRGSISSRDRVSQDMSCPPALQYLRDLLAEYGITAELRHGSVGLAGGLRWPIGSRRYYTE
jgi:hypothetical protein